VKSANPSIPDLPEHCWKKIGVFSKTASSCPKLKTFIHCRNCDVFTQAGRNLLDRDTPHAYMDDWAGILATKKEEEPPDTISVLIFRIGSEWLAFRTRLFAEVIDPEQFHSLPHRKNPILMGVVNVHGEIQLCISLKALLDIEDNDCGEKDRRVYQRMMVIHHHDDRWVFPVDEIFGIYRVYPNNFENVPVTIAKSSATFTKALFKWKDRSVAFLDDELLLLTLARNVS